MIPNELMAPSISFISLADTPATNPVLLISNAIVVNVVTAVRANSVSSARRRSLAANTLTTINDDIGQIKGQCLDRRADVDTNMTPLGIGTVLLVEDEDAVRLFGARALRNKGYNVLEARSGEAALEIVNSAAATNSRSIS